MAEPAEVKRTKNNSTSIEGLEDFLEVQEVVPEEVHEDDERAHEKAHEEDVLTKYWTTAEAAVHLNVSVRTIMKKLKDGSLVGTKIEGKYRPEWRIKPIDVETNDHKEDESKDGDSAVHDQVHEPDHEGVEERLLPAYGKPEFIEMLEMLRQKDHELQGAIYRNGYLESQLEAQQSQVKLLEDKSHKVEKVNNELELVQEAYTELEEEHLAMKDELEKYKAIAERSGWRKFSDWLLGQK